MASKKKSSKVKSGSDTPNKRMARAAAIEITGQYLHAPNNRAQVINPPGASFVQGGDAWFNETKGRFRAADKVYTRSYNEIKSNLDKKIPSGSKPKAKKLPVPKKPLNPSATKPFNVQPKKFN